MIASIKSYIKAANKRKSLIQQSEKEADMEKKHSQKKIEVQNEIRKNEANQFQINEVNQLVKDLEVKIKIQRDEVENEQFQQMKRQKSEV